MAYQPKMRLALAALIVVLATATILVVVGNAGPRDPLPDRSPTERAIEAGLLVRSPVGVRKTCRATTEATIPPRCPPALPVPDGEWGRARALDKRRCEYLIDVEPGRARGLPSHGPVFHLLFGGRCEPFDLSTRKGRWPARPHFLPRGLRLVGSRPLSPGESARGLLFKPARPQLIDQLRIAGRPALLLRYPARPLTTVHSGHLAIIWNEASAGYAVSAHPLSYKDEEVARALRSMALAMHAPNDE